MKMGKKPRTFLYSKRMKILEGWVKTKLNFKVQIGFIPLKDLQVVLTTYFVWLKKRTYRSSKSLLKKAWFSFLKKVCTWNSEEYIQYTLYRIKKLPNEMWLSSMQSSHQISQLVFIKRWNSFSSTFTFLSLLLLIIISTKTWMIFENLDNQPKNIKKIWCEKY